MPSVNNNSFLSLIRMGLGHLVYVQPDNLDWNTIQTLGLRHGLSAIVIDGIERLPERKRPPKELLLEWIGDLLQRYEYRYALYQRTISELAGFYNGYGYKMMVLKGYACSLDWPKPEHRPCGDIDLWLFGKQKEADALLTKEKGIAIDKSHHHHTVFEWNGFTVENHYDFVNVHAHRSSAELEKVFKELGKDDSHYVDVCGERVYLPTPNLHALFLIKHMVSHFAAAEISLRQVLDWAFFVEKYGKEVDWEWLNNMLDKYHMKEFFNLVNAICVEDLGFTDDIFPIIQYLPSNKESVLDDIIDPAFTSAEPKFFFSRMIYKYKRWQGNAWKQEMCYGESRWEMFWMGIWAKLIKPSSI